MKNLLYLILHSLLLFEKEKSKASCVLNKWFPSSPFFYPPFAKIDIIWAFLCSFFWSVKLCLALSDMYAEGHLVLDTGGVTLADDATVM